jgi:hypothetical protein
MITVRQLERFWQDKSFERISRLCLEMRPENSIRLAIETSRAVPAAALAVIRLDELNQSHAPFCGRMIRVILAAQEADGGWGDGATTALCLRALSCSSGQGPAIDRGIEYLRAIQKDDGSFPRVPLRRMPADAFTTALVVYHLTDNAGAAEALDLDAAAAFLDSQAEELDAETRRLWRCVALRRELARCANRNGFSAARVPAGSPAWS